MRFTAGLLNTGAGVTRTLDVHGLTVAPKGAGTGVYKCPARSGDAGCHERLTNELSSADWDEGGMSRWCRQGWQGVVMEDWIANRLAGSATHVSHELLADGPHVLGEGCREHHHLLVVGSGLEDSLNVSSHVCNTTSSRQHSCNATLLI